MRPSDLKSLRVFLEAIRNEIVSLRLQLQEHTRSARDSTKAQENQQESIAAALMRLRKSEDERVREQSTEERHHGENLMEQRRLRRWTAAAFIAAAIYAGLAYFQWRTMNGTYSEIQKQTNAAQKSAYVACLSAQAAQMTLLQIQQSASDSHASAAATVEQSTANMVAQRSIISITPRMPDDPGEFFNNQLRIPYITKNEGKSEALKFSEYLTAVLLDDDDTLHIVHRPPLLMSGALAAGGQIPEQSPDPRYRSVIDTIPVKDNDGNIVSATSQKAKAFLTGERGTVFIYGSLSYMDFFGSHDTQFCLPMKLVLPGAMTKTTKAQNNCVAYNKPNDQYTQMPKLGASLLNWTRVEPIKCSVPTY